MSDLKFMPMYWADFMADTAHLSCLQSGSYLLLLGQMWLRGGWVPDDDEQLARMCRLKLAKWREIKPAIQPFLVTRGGKLSQKRLLSMHKSVSETHKKTVAKTAKMRRAKHYKKQGLAASKEAYKEDIARARPDIGISDTNVSVEPYSPLNPPKGGNARKRAKSHSSKNKPEELDAYFARRVLEEKAKENGHGNGSVPYLRCVEAGDEAGEGAKSLPPGQTAQARRH